jgi:hypothetical protein
MLVMKAITFGLQQLKEDVELCLKSKAADATRQEVRDMYSQRLEYLAVGSRSLEEALNQGQPQAYSRHSRNWPSD